MLWAIYGFGVLFKKILYPFFRIQNIPTFLGLFKFLFKFKGLWLWDINVKWGNLSHSTFDGKAQAGSHSVEGPAVDS